jgi:hypothetical protein
LALSQNRAKLTAAGVTSGVVNSLSGKGMTNALDFVDREGSKETIDEKKQKITEAGFELDYASKEDYYKSLSSKFTEDSGKGLKDAETYEQYLDREFSEKNADERAKFV